MRRHTGDIVTLFVGIVGTLFLLSLLSNVMQPILLMLNPNAREIENRLLEGTYNLRLFEEYANFAFRASFNVFLLTTFVTYLFLSFRGITQGINYLELRSKVVLTDKQTVITDNNTQVKLYYAPAVLRQSANTYDDLSEEQKTDYFTSPYPVEKYHSSFGVDKIFLGIDATHTPVYTTLKNAVHFLIVGKSGFGKSIFMYTILKQLALSEDSVAFSLIDTQAATFGGLMLPKQEYATITDSNIALDYIDALLAERNNRKKLFADCPRASNIFEYNQITGDDLPLKLTCIEEATATFRSNGDIPDSLQNLIETGRQLGLYFALSGQTFRANVFPSETKEQFSSRIGFYSTRRNLSYIFDSVLEVPSQKGMALLDLPGRKTQIIQTPFTTKNDLLALNCDTTKHFESNAVTTNSSNSVENSIIELHAQGNSINSICNEIYGYTGGKAYNEVKRVLSKK